MYVLYLFLLMVFLISDIILFCLKQYDSTAVEPPAPLVKDDNVVPDNEPVIISFPILTVMLFPVGKFVAVESVNEVALALIVAI